MTVHAGQLCGLSLRSRSGDRRCPCRQVAFPAAYAPHTWEHVSCYCVAIRSKGFNYREAVETLEVLLGVYSVSFLIGYSIGLDISAAMLRAILPPAARKHSSVWIRHFSCGEGLYRFQTMLGWSRHGVSMSFSGIGSLLFSKCPGKVLLQDASCLE